jgi:hypothetical protein
VIWFSTWCASMRSRPISNIILPSGTNGGRVGNSRRSLHWQVP